MAQLLPLLRLLLLEEEEEDKNGFDQL